MDEFMAKLCELLSEQFIEQKSVSPVLLFSKPGGIEVLPLGEMIDHKDFVAALIRKLRSMSPQVCFVSECWVVTDAKKGVVPSKHPDREEIVMVMTYEGLDVGFWSAPILRSGDWAELGKWEKKDCDHIEGRMVEGPPSWN